MLLSRISVTESEAYKQGQEAGAGGRIIDLVSFKKAEKLPSAPADVICG